MIYPDKERSREFARVFQEAKDLTTIETAQRLIQIEPTFAPGYISLALFRADAGDPEEAESLAWKALALWPCSYYTYHTVASLRI